MNAFGYRRRPDPFVDEYGFTTTGMALALLVTLALLFSAAQVYRINAASAEVQDVADAAALAAENQVAEFMLVARVCDALILSLSLTGAMSAGLGVVCLCTPATASASEVFLKTAREIFQARDRFADAAVETLESIQKALPFLAAARAAAVASANDSSTLGSQYVGIAVLVPDTGKAIECSSPDAEEVLDDIDSRAEGVREEAARAEEAAGEAAEAKERGFAADCGRFPDACMFERAGSLASLSAEENPRFNSVDTWSFSVGLERARVYYGYRLTHETPLGSSVEEQGRSYARLQFYRYACERMQEAYVHESGDSFDASLPHLPKNTAEMRETSLYTAKVFPVTEGEGGSYAMHACPGCPKAGNVVFYGSIKDMEEGDYGKCPICGFSAASMGKVAAASTSIPNGFEYHYEEFVRAAEDYERARLELDPLRDQVKDDVNELFSQLKELLKKVGGTRIDPAPPGRSGAVALVANVGSLPAPFGFENGFIAERGELGPRVAISAATLLDEESDEGANALSSVLDGFKDEGGALVGAAGLVLSCWSGALDVYRGGQESCVQAVRDALDALPLASASGLGSWAAKALEEAVAAAGLQPAKTEALKPVLVNSGHVAAAGEDSFSSGYLEVKRQVIARPFMSGNLFGSLLSNIEESAFEGLDLFGEDIEIASIELFGEEGPSIPLKIPLPPAVRGATKSAMDELFARIRSLYAEASGAVLWE